MSALNPIHIFIWVQSYFTYCMLYFLCNRVHIFLDETSVEERLFMIIRISTSSIQNFLTSFCLKVIPYLCRSCLIIWVVLLLECFHLLSSPLLLHQVNLHIFILKLLIDIILSFFRQIWLIGDRFPQEISLHLVIFANKGDGSYERRSKEFIFRSMSGIFEFSNTLLNKCFPGHPFMFLCLRVKLFFHLLLSINC